MVCCKTGWAGTVFMRTGFLLRFQITHNANRYAEICISTAFTVGTQELCNFICHSKFNLVSFEIRYCNNYFVDVAEILEYFPSINANLSEGMYKNAWRSRSNSRNKTFIIRVLSDNTSFSETSSLKSLFGVS